MGLVLDTFVLILTYILAPKKKKRKKNDAPQSRSKYTNTPEKLF